MPYQSEAQRRWAHTPEGMRALGGPKAVEEWDRATKGKKLPERASKSDREKLKEAMDEAERRRAKRDSEKKT